MARATLRDVGKRFGEAVAVGGFSLDAADGELVTILGPSGCGKSTLLRLIAGLEALDEGTIHLDDRRIDRLPPDERNVAMVFQSYALYPHMTVRGNVEFPLRMRGVGREERRRRAQEIAELLELSDVLERRPATISGGQRQRVALARALVRHPALFLLDEPLSNLDARLRVSVRRYIRDVQKRLAVTALYVTHDQTEAMTLGDRIVVLDRGRLQQVGAPMEIYDRPANAFVAGFVGTPPMNLLPGAVEDGVVAVGGQRVALAPEVRERIGALSRVTVGIRPEAFVATDGEGIDGDRAAAAAGALVATPDPATRELLGAETIVSAGLGDERIAVRLLGGAREVPACVAAPAEALHFFSADDGSRLGP